MSDLVGDAAEMIVPVLSMGGVAVARDTIERGGVQLSEAFWAFLGKLRTQKKHKAIPKAEVESALRTAIADGQLGARDLATLLSHKDTIGRLDVIGNGSGNTVIHGKNVITDSNITGENITLS